MLVEGSGIKGPAIVAAVAGSVFAGLLQAIGPSPSPVTVITGVLSGISVFLFSMFIRQGQKMAALEAYSKRNKDDIDRIDADTRTIDKRDAESRHMVKNEVTPVIADVELRVMQRQEEARLMLISVEERFRLRTNELRDEQVKQIERLNRHIEAGD